MPWFVGGQTRATEESNMHSIPVGPSSRKRLAKKSSLPSQRPVNPRKSPQFSSRKRDRLGNGHGVIPKQKRNPKAENHALSASRTRRLADAPPWVRGFYLRAWSRRSRKAAIRGFCLACVGYSPSEVTNCTAPACSLYEYRLKG